MQWMMQSLGLYGVRRPWPRCVYTRWSFSVALDPAAECWSWSWQRERVLELEVVVTSTVVKVETSGQARRHRSLLNWLSITGQERD